VWKPIALLLMIIAIIGWTVWSNMNPTRCPLCRRINLFRRKKIGQSRDERDEGGDLVRSSTEFVCTRCGGRYWMVWDDFEGRSASISPPDSHARNGK